MSHTPGPWTMTSEPYEDGTPYCRIKAGNPFLSDEEMGFELSAIMRPADASLVVSAPLMLAALEAIVEPWSGFSDHELSLYYRPILAARVVIKAARGGGDVRK